MEKYYTVQRGKIIQLPEISTDFYAKIQDLLLLMSAPEVLVQMKTENEQSYYEMLSPIMEFLGAVEEKMIAEGIAVQEELPKP